MPLGLQLKDQDIHGGAGLNKSGLGEKGGQDNTKMRWKTSGRLIFLFEPHYPEIGEALGALNETMAYGKDLEGGKLLLCCLCGLKD